MINIVRDEYSNNDIINEDAHDHHHKNIEQLKSAKKILSKQGKQMHYHLSCIGQSYDDQCIINGDIDSESKALLDENRILHSYLVEKGLIQEDAVEGF